MKQFLRTVFIFSLTLVLVHTNVSAQCPAGYTRDTLNWDYLDYLPNSADYSSYVTLAQSQTQRFAFGTQKITIVHNYTGANIAGENAGHTAQAGSFGNGQNVEFTGDGTMTFSFSDTVQNLRFSLYDIDRSQVVNVTANNGVSPAIVTLSTVTTAILALSNNNTSSATATAANSSAEVTSTDGTLNVHITGPVTSVTLTITATGTANGNAATRENGSFWLSDISACSEGTFPANYYAVSQPYANQPSYVIIARNDSVYYVDVATGRAKFIFADYGHDRINSVAYDPVRHFIYYTYSLTGSGGAIGNNRVLRRYDYNMDTLGIVASDTRTLGVPLYDYGVESGAAAFYDGSLYLGIEAGSASSREAVIWKIDFNAQYAPSGLASQVFATDGAEHDWADFGVSNGILYDFDGRGSNTDFYHKNLLTGTVTHYDPSPNSLIPRQTGVDWNGVLYNMGSSSSISAATVVPYNNNGSVNTAQEYNITFNGVAISGSWGDAAEAFKPKTDFGDAPASYDPGPGVAGTHEKDPLLRLGANTGIEWTKNVSANATGDGAEEDALNGFQVIATGTSNFVLPVSVYNNTGAPATLAGWIDANGDGQFQAAEGRSITVASSASQQTIMLQWSVINVTLPANTTTFLRLRLTSASNGMTTANPTGFFLNGEIEDHPILTSLVLFGLPSYLLAR